MACIKYEKLASSRLGIQLCRAMQEETHDDHHLGEPHSDKLQLLQNLAVAAKDVLYNFFP